MLLYVIKKMIIFDETGVKIEDSKSAHLSLVNNFAGQIQAILRFNFKSEANNSSNSMKKIYEICYLFLKVCYKNDRDLFLSQFNLFVDPVLALRNKRSREDSISRITFLGKMISKLAQLEESKDDLKAILCRNPDNYSVLKLTLEGFIDDFLTVVLAPNSSKSQLDNLNIKIINDKLDTNLYLGSILSVMQGYLTLLEIWQDKAALAIQKKIKFILSFLSCSDHIIKKTHSKIVEGSPVDNYEIHSFLATRKPLLKLLHSLVNNAFEFSSEELAFIYKILMTYIKIGGDEYSKVLKNILTSLVSSPHAPKDLVFFELIQAYSASSPKNISLMCSLYQHLQNEGKEEESKTKVKLGDTILEKLIDQAQQEDFDQENFFLLLNTRTASSSKPLAEKFLKFFGSKQNGNLLVPILSNFSSKVRLGLVPVMITLDLLWLLTALTEFFDYYPKKDVSKINTGDKLLETTRDIVLHTAQTLGDREPVSQQRKISIILTGLKLMSHLVLRNSTRQNKKLVVLLIFSFNSVLYQKMNTKYLEETALCITGKHLLTGRHRRPLVHSGN